MNKSELERIYQILSDCRDNLSDAYYDYKIGSNAKIKNAAERKMNSEISLAKRWVDNEEIYQIVTEGKTGYERAVSIEGTFSTDYFYNDMEKILVRLKFFINSL